MHRIVPPVVAAEGVVVVAAADDENISKALRTTCQCVHTGCDE